MDTSANLTVIKLGGKLLQDLKLLRSGLKHLLPALACPDQKFVFVHGGGAFVDQWLTALGHPIIKQHGLRVTPREQMPVICGALSGFSNKSLVGVFSQLGLNALGLCLSDAKAFLAEPISTHADLGQVGKIRPHNLSFLESLLVANVIPVLSSIAWDDEGELFNINADHAAIAIAQALKANKLIFLSDQDGVFNQIGEVEQLIDSPKAEALVSSGAVINGMKVKLETALRASKDTHAPIHIANGLLPTTWQRMATNDAVGTTVIGY